MASISIGIGRPYPLNSYLRIGPLWYGGVKMRCLAMSDRIGHSDGIARVLPAPLSRQAAEWPINPGLNMRRQIMNWRAFRLHEMHRRIDEALRAEQRRGFPNPFEIMRLKLKLAIKDRLAMLARKQARA